jgi:hypothetical protein
LKGIAVTDIKPEKSNEQKRTLKQWLFNPFQFIAGGSALLTGLAVMLASAFLGSLSNTHFDGVLDVHSGKVAPLWFFITEVPIDWLCISVVLLIAGFIVSRSSLRIVDVFGTQALARAPHLISALALLPKGSIRFTNYLVSKITQQVPAEAIKSTDILFFAAGLIIVLLMTVWIVVLMYRAYAVSCNVKGGKAVGSFIVALIVAEILSKIAIWQLALRTGLLSS